MAINQTFVDFVTPVPADWLNNVNTVVNGGFSVTVPGGISRTLTNIINDYVNVKNYGADPANTATANSTAFQAAFNTGKPIHIPAGIYQLNTALTLTNQNVVIVGDGMGVTELQFIQAVGTGITINQNKNHFSISLSDFDITTTTSGVDTAINIVYPGSADSFNDRYDITNTVNRVRVKQPTGTITTACWKNGIKFFDVCNVVLDECSFTGQASNVSGINFQPTTFKSLQAITFDGAWFPVDIRVMNSYFTAWDICYKFGLTVQGVDISHCTHLFSRVGIQWYATPEQPYLNLTDSHMNIFQNAVDITGVNQSMISGCLLYAAANENQSANLVQIGTSCFTVDIHDNQFVSFATSHGANLVVLASGAGSNSVHDNWFDASGGVTSTGIWLQSSSTYDEVNKNRFLGTYTTQAILDSGSTTPVYGSPGALVSLGTIQSIPSGVNTAVTMNTLTSGYDSNTFWGGGSSPLLTIPVGTGFKRVRVSGSLGIQASTSTVITVWIAKNGAQAYPGVAIISRASNGTNADYFDLCTGIVTVGDGDTFQLMVNHNHGSNLNTSADGTTWLSLEVIN